MNKGPTRHPRKKRVTTSKLDRARDALSELLICDDVDDHFSYHEIASFRTAISNMAKVIK